MKKKELILFDVRNIMNRELNYVTFKYSVRVVFESEVIFKNELINSKYTNFYSNTFLKALSHGTCELRMGKFLKDCKFMTLMCYSLQKNSFSF